MEIISIFTVTDFKTRKQYKEAINGFGQEAINFLRKDYPRLTKYVLNGFEINGKFMELNLKTFNSIK